MEKINVIYCKVGSFNSVQHFLRKKQDYRQKQCSKSLPLYKWAKINCSYLSYKNIFFTLIELQPGLNDLGNSILDCISQPFSAYIKK